MTIKVESRLSDYLGIGAKGRVILRFRLGSRARVGLPGRGYQGAFPLRLVSLLLSIVASRYSKDCLYESA